MDMQLLANMDQLEAVLLRTCMTFQKNKVLKHMMEEMSEKNRKVEVEGDAFEQLVMMFAFYGVSHIFQKGIQCNWSLEKDTD